MLAQEGFRAVQSFVLWEFSRFLSPAIVIYDQLYVWGHCHGAK